MFNIGYSPLTKEKTGRAILGTFALSGGKVFMTDRNFNLPRRQVSPLRVRKDTEYVYYIPKNATIKPTSSNHVEIHNFNPTYRMECSYLVLGDEIKRITLSNPVGHMFQPGFLQSITTEGAYAPLSETIKLTKEIFEEIKENHKVAYLDDLNPTRRTVNSLSRFLSNIPNAFVQKLTNALNLDVYGNSIVDGEELMIVIGSKNHPRSMFTSGEHLVFDGEVFKIINAVDLDSYQDQITATFTMGYFPRLNLDIPEDYPTESLIELLGFKLKPYHFKARDIILNAWNEVSDYNKDVFFENDGDVIDLSDSDDMDALQDLFSHIGRVCRTQLCKNIDMDKCTEKETLYHLYADDGIDTGIYILGTGECSIDGLPVALFDGELCSTLDLIKGHDEKLEALLQVIIDY